MLQLVLFTLLLASYTEATFKAVLVAGSNGWENYRHQADIFHAYTELIQNKVSPNDITLFAYNDISYNALNPTPGVVINRPNGTNVFPGNKSIDFSGNDVTPKNFLNVLTNLSDPNTDLLIFFSDHGGPGLICFPNEYLYVDDLRTTMLAMQYRSLVFIMEACEAGSMFDDWLPTNTKAFALAATNPFEPSYACYYDDQLGTNLGDVFSVNVLQFLDTADNNIESLGLLSDVVQNQTDTSPVTLYGDMSLFDVKLLKYWGYHLGGVQIYDGSPKRITKRCIKHVKTIVSWDIPREIGKVKKDDTRFNYIREQDDSARALYNTLRTSLRLYITGEVGNYTSPVNSKCIRACIEVLSSCKIKLKGYSNLFIRDIAYLCDEYPDRATKLILGVGHHIMHMH